jgi:CHAT domain-containing protein
VIHLATHFRLGGDTAKSFLLLGGNQALTLEKVSDNTTLNFGDVELVTLSACNTGFGAVVENKNASREQERKLLEENNGVEVDSLATFIELRGAKAVLASLWSVADESTGVLMSEFYRLRKDNPNMTKAEAMRQAQLLMIQGKLKPSPGNPVCRSEVVNLEGTKQPLFKCDAKAPYSHPYFWSPFVLIGNWR